MTFDFPTSLISLAVVLYALVAIGDLRSREIPNWLVLAVFVLGLGKAPLSGSTTQVMFDLGAALVAFVVVLPLFMIGALGGGDTKLIPASVLLVGYHDAFAFIIDMSLLGGVLALITIVTQMARNSRQRRNQGQPLERPTVPYGVAIAGAAVAAILQFPQG